MTLQSSIEHFDIKTHMMAYQDSIFDIIQKLDNSFFFSNTRLYFTLKNSMNGSRIGIVVVLLEKYFKAIHYGNLLVYEAHPANT